MFAVVGEPVFLLIFAGAFNGLILPLTLGSVLLAAHYKEIVKDYTHPLWMTVFGGIVAIGTAVLGIRTLLTQLQNFF